MTKQPALKEALPGNLITCSACKVGLHYEVLPSGILVRRSDGYRAECPSCGRHFVFPSLRSETARKGQPEQP